MKIKEIIRKACEKRGITPEHIEKIMVIVKADMRGFEDILEREVPEDEVQDHIDECAAFTEVMSKLNVPVDVAKAGIEKAKDEIRRNN